MPRPTPFHPRTLALCKSLLFKEWAGCYAVRRYDNYHDREYYALRHQATLMDASPLYKYEVRGANAADLLGRVTVRGFNKFGVGRVTYVCWCDEHGKVLDDGTITRLEEHAYRLTSTEPTLAWLQKNSRGLDVTIEDATRKLAALALQGPLARDVLRPIVDEDIDGLRFFRAQHVHYRLASGMVPGVVSRTGYTGDLGYELWVAAAHALELFDAVMESGTPLGMLPMGLDALDVARVEAGFLLAGIDYQSARSSFIERQKSTPFELGFDWMVKVDREPFVGQEALRSETEAGPKRKLVGLEIDWDEFEAIHDSFGLVPHLTTETCRLGVPVYAGGAQVGYATSRAWSPTLKKYLALASIGAEFSAVGKELSIEVTCEYERHRAKARVTPTPFFNPERKKS